MSEERSYDLIVAGGGVAGLTAALFAVRFGLSTLVIERLAPGGHLVNLESIEDFPGFPNGVAGYELGPLVHEQAAKYGAQFQMAEVNGLESKDSCWNVQTTEGAFHAKAAIVATGCRPRDMGVPGESELRGKGISNCASCDGPLFGDQVVGVVGGGNHALQEALALTNYAAQIILFHSEGNFAAQSVFQQRVLAEPKISLRYNTIVDEILGNDAVRGIVVRDAVTGASAEVELAGIFVYAGMTPNTDFLRGVLHLDQAGYISTDAWMRTEIRGLFAAGNLRQGSMDFAISSSSDGVLAAAAAHRYINDGIWPTA